MDPDMALSSNSCPDVTMDPLAAQATQISMAQQQHGPRTPTGSQVEGQTLGFHTLNKNDCMAESHLNVRSCIKKSQHWEG